MRFYQPFLLNFSARNILQKRTTIQTHAGAHCSRIGLRPALMTSVCGEWLQCMISIVCCHSAKFCSHVARAFRSRKNGAVTRMWRSCQVQTSLKERAIGAVVVKRRGCCCKLSSGVALNVWRTTNGMCAKNNTIYMWREQAIIEWSWQVNSIVASCHSGKLCAMPLGLCDRYTLKLTPQRKL